MAGLLLQKNMKDLGNAVASKWGRASFYINWSEGSYWNNGVVPDISLHGSRFIQTAAKRAAWILNQSGYKSAESIEFLGHSWGTWFGYRLASVMPGNYARLFALDPAPSAPKLGSKFPPGKFASVARYSMAIYGCGAFGSATFATRAHDAIALLPPDGTENLARHSEPVIFAQKLFANTAPSFVNDAFSFAIAPGAVNLSFRPWQLNKYIYIPNPLVDWANLKPTPGFEASLATDGNGNVDEQRYFSSLPPTVGSEIVQSSIP